MRRNSTPDGVGTEEAWLVSLQTHTHTKGVFGWLMFVVRRWLVAVYLVASIWVIVYFFLEDMSPTVSYPVIIIILIFFFQRVSFVRSGKAGNLRALTTVTI